MKIAREVSTWSKDPGHRVGAVIVRDRRILATGYNGPPAGIVDDDRFLDRGFKLLHTIHAEMNAIVDAGRRGVSVDSSTMYVYGLPTCSNCAKHACQSGVSRLVVPKLEGVGSEQWWDDFFDVTQPMMRECGVAVDFVDISQLSV